MIWAAKAGWDNKCLSSYSKDFIATFNFLAPNSAKMLFCCYSVKQWHTLVDAMGTRHPRFLRSNTSAPLTASTIFWDLLMRDTHNLKVLTRALFPQIKLWLVWIKIDYLNKCHQKAAIKTKKILLLTVWIQQNKTKWAKSLAN